MNDNEKANEIFFDPDWRLYLLKRQLCRTPPSVREPLVLPKKFAKQLTSGFLQKDINEDEVVDVLRELLVINNDVSFNVCESEYGVIEISLIMTKRLREVPGIMSSAYISIVFIEIRKVEMEITGIYKEDFNLISYNYSDIFQMKFNPFFDRKSNTQVRLTLNMKKSDLQELIHTAQQMLKEH